MTVMFHSVSLYAVMLATQSAGNTHTPCCDLKPASCTPHHHTCLVPVPSHAQVLCADRHCAEVLQEREGCSIQPTQRSGCAGVCGQM